MINNIFIICFQVTKFNWKSLQAGFSYNSQLFFFSVLTFQSLAWLWIKMLIMSVLRELKRSNSGCAMLQLLKWKWNHLLNFPRNILIKMIFCYIRNTCIALFKFLLHQVCLNNLNAQICEVFNDLSYFLCVKVTIILSVSIYWLRIYTFASFRDLYFLSQFLSMFLNLRFAILIDLMSPLS